MIRVRLFQAGDLPGRSNRINFKKVKKLIEACKGLLAFGYTHKPLDVGNNSKIIKYCNKNGITINLSANCLKHADKLFDKKIGPVTVVLPQDFNEKVTYTPKGRKVIVCPAILNDKITCSKCGGKMPLCCKQDRDFIIGFIAHGARAKKASTIAKGE